MSPNNCSNISKQTYTSIAHLSRLKIKYVQRILSIIVAGKRECFPDEMSREGKPDEGTVASLAEEGGREGAPYSRKAYRLRRERRLETSCFVSSDFFRDGFLHRVAQEGIVWPRYTNDVSANSVPVPIVCRPINIFTL